MTATRHCEKCQRDTTHRVLVGRPGSDYEEKTALQCVVCGTAIVVQITGKTEER